MIQYVGHRVGMNICFGSSIDRYVPCRLCPIPNSPNRVWLTGKNYGKSTKPCAQAIGPPCITVYPETISKYRKRKSTNVKEEMKGEADEEVHSRGEVAIKCEPEEGDSDEEQHFVRNEAVEIKNEEGGDAMKQEQDAEENSPQQKRRALTQVSNIYGYQEPLSKTLLSLITPLIGRDSAGAVQGVLGADADGGGVQRAHEVLSPGRGSRPPLLLRPVRARLSL